MCRPGYQFELDKYQPKAGLFSQVIWKESVELGIGAAVVHRRGMNCMYIVGRYKPPGNFKRGKNDYTRNVQKGSFDKTTYCAKLRRFKDDFQNSNDLDQSKLGPGVTLQEGEPRKRTIVHKVHKEKS